MVKVRLFANFREIVGKHELTIEAKTLLDLLKKLVKQCPALNDLIFEGDTVRDYVNIAVNGEIVRDLGRKLSEEDVVAIFPPFSGG